MDPLDAILQRLGLHVDLAPGDIATLALVLVFAAASLGVLGAAALLAPDPLARRLRGIAAARANAEGAVPTLLRGRHGPGRWEALLDRLAGRAGRGGAGASDLRTRLLQAGFEGPKAYRIYLLLRLLLAFGTPPVGLAALGAAGAQGTVVATTFLALGLAVLGFALPGRWLARRLGRRRQAIRAGLPEALDMMVVCVEAGLGLDATLTRVGAQIAPAHPILSTELGLVALQLRAGKGRQDALRGLARRTGLREVGSLAMLLIQSDALGTGIAQALRVYAEEMRAARLLRAEEMAHKLPVKLTLPLVACILPAMMAVVLLPGVITIVRDVLPGLGQ